MTATVFLDTPMDGTQTLECETAKLVGDVLLAEATDSDRKQVVPMQNVAGIDGDDVEKRIEAVEYEGGRMNELVTTIE
ncbi:hypothetical protein ACFQJ7_14965 [Halovenus rubra]|uniref:Uncharacterized protein n=2 Tax=Halovenus rubra TaxID=869890 RepID=A0ABD5X7U3_9EURY|nr:hypothetical protein [Halovenus rubra]